MVGFLGHATDHKAACSTTRFSRMALVAGALLLESNMLDKDTGNSNGDRNGNYKTRILAVEERHAHSRNQHQLWK